MDEVCQQCMDDASRVYACPQDDRSLGVVLNFAVVPGATLSWRVDADTAVRVQGARVWLTRIGSPYDHWLQPGNELRLQRGERVWISTDGDVVARVSLSSSRPLKRGMIGQWLDWLAALHGDWMTPRSR